MQTKIEQEWLAAFRQDEGWSKEKIYTHYYQPVSDLCRRYARSREDGEDLAQEVMCKVILQKKLSSFKGKSGLWTWIRRIAINDCHDFYRKGKRTQLGQSLSESGQGRAERLPAKEMNPEEILIQEEEARLAETQLNKLAGHYQEAIRLTCYQEVSYQEAARKMGVPVRVLGVYRHRGVKQLSRLCQASMRSASAFQFQRA